MGIFKYKSGLIFDDRFVELHSRWLLSPSDKGVVVDGSLVLEHGSEDTLALFHLPSDDVVLEIAANYYPVEEGDEGGIVIWKSSQERLEFLESRSVDKIGEYTVWRASREGDLWTFYAKKDGVWELFDTAPLDASMAGAVLKGNSNPNYQTLNINKVVLCTGDTLGIGNLTSGMMVVLADSRLNPVSSKIVPIDYTGVSFRLPSLPFTGYVHIYNQEGVSISLDGPIDFYGGDIYMVGEGLRLLENGVPLNPYNFNHLGKMQYNQILKQLELRNDGDRNYYGVKIAVKQYNDEFGWDWVDLSIDQENYYKVLTLGDIHHNESKFFWVRVTRDEDLAGFKPCRFVVDIEFEGAG